MLTSDLNRKIYIQKQTETKGGYGVLKDEWWNFIEGFCRADFGRGDSTFNQNMETNLSDARFLIRWREGVNYDCRVLFEGKIYLIDHIEPLGFRGKDGIRLHCTRRENL